MKLGKMIVRGLGAGMTAYGKTLTDQAAEQQRERALDGALMRQQALADYTNAQALKRIDAQASANVGEHRANAQTDTAEQARRLPLVTEAKIKEERERLLTDFNIWLKKQPIELQAKLTLADFEQDRLDSRNVYTQGQETGRAKMREDRQDARAKAARDEDVVATGVDAEGNTVVAKGNDTHVTFRGMKPQPKTPMFSDGLPGAQAQAAAPPAPEPAAPDKTYTLEDLKYSAAQRGISLDEARIQANAAGYRLRAK